MSGCSSIFDAWENALSNEEKLTQICITSQSIASIATNKILEAKPEAAEPMLLVVSTIQVMFNSNDLAPDVIEAKVESVLQEKKIFRRTCIISKRYSSFSS